MKWSERLSPGANQVDCSNGISELRMGKAPMAGNDVLLMRVPSPTPTYFKARSDNLRSASN